MGYQPLFSSYCLIRSAARAAVRARLYRRKWVNSRSSAERGDRGVAHVDPMADAGAADITIVPPNQNRKKEIGGAARIRSAARAAVRARLYRRKWVNSSPHRGVASPPSAKLTPWLNG